MQRPLLPTAAAGPGRNFPNFALIWDPTEIFPKLRAKSLESCGDANAVF